MKKIIKFILAIIISLIIGYIVLLNIQNYSFISSFEKETSEDFNQKGNEFIRCNYNILHPEFAFIFDIKGGNEGHASFYKPNKLFSQLEQEWDISRIGGTTIKNTTFPELVKMVKEDCGQFQHGYYDETELGDITGMSDSEKLERWNETKLKNINWTYTRAQTEKEKADYIREYGLYDENRLQSFGDIYGDIDEMTDEEVVVLKKRIDEEGLDRRVELEIKVSDIKNEINRLTNEQYEKVKSYYGDIKKISDKELLEWAEKVREDRESGKFSL